MVQRYQLSLRAGLPAASGEGLVKDVARSTLYVRDRSAVGAFPRPGLRARAHPRCRPPGGHGQSPATVDLTLHRVDDRNVMQMIQENHLRPSSCLELGGKRRLEKRAGRAGLAAEAGDRRAGA